MNHKRRRPKHQRAGCLFCSPHKDERRRQRGARSDRRANNLWQMTHTNAVRPSVGDMPSTRFLLSEIAWHTRDGWPRIDEDDDPEYAEERPDGTLYQVWV